MDPKYRDIKVWEKLTPKQQKFVQEYIATGNASEAYRRSYNVGNKNQNTIKRSAFELLCNPNITSTLARLKEEASKKAQMTVLDIVDMLKEDRQFAYKCEQPAAAISASLGIAKMFGFGAEKTENVNKHEIIITGGLPDNLFAEVEIPAEAKAIEAGKPDAPG